MWEQEQEERERERSCLSLLRPDFSRRSRDSRWETRGLGMIHGGQEYRNRTRCIHRVITPDTLLLSRRSRIRHRGEWSCKEKQKTRYSVLPRCRKTTCVYVWTTDKGQPTALFLSFRVLRKFCFRWKLSGKLTLFVSTSLERSFVASLRDYAVWCNDPLTQYNTILRIIVSLFRYWYMTMKNGIFLFFCFFFSRIQFLKDYR